MLATSLGSTDATAQQQEQSCVSQDDCAGAFDQCQHGQCVAPPKKCQADCSGRGYCVFIDSASNVEVKTCTVGQVGCDAVCVCEDAYTGSATCSSTTEELALRQTARLQILQALQQLIALEDADELVISGWLSALAQASQQVDELSDDAAQHILTSIETVLQYAQEVGVSSDVASGALQTIDAVLQRVSLAAGPSRTSASRRRSLLAAGSVSSSVSSSNLSVNATVHRAQAAQFRSILLQDLLPGQDAIQSVYTSFRSHVQIIAPAGSNGGVSLSASAGGNMSVSLPTTALEALNNVTLGAVSFPLHSTALNAANITALSISLTSLSAQLINAANNGTSSSSKSSTNKTTAAAASRVYSAHPMTLTISDVPCATTSDSSDACRMIIEMPLTPDFASAALQQSEITTFNTTCAAGDDSVHTHTCPDGTPLVVHCNATATTSNIVHSRCPVISHSAVCNSLSTATQAGGKSNNSSSSCSVLAVSAESITCSCQLQSSTAAAHQRRRLSGNNGNDGSSGSGGSGSQGEVSVSYVAMLDSVTESFVDTLESVDSLNSNTVQKGWSALLTVGLITGAVICALFWSYQADQEVLKLKKDEKKEKSAAEEKALQAIDAANSNIKSADLEKRLDKFQKGKKRRVLTKPKAAHPMSADLQLVEQSLPQILSSRTMSQKILTEMKAHHRWFAVAFVYSEHFPRLLRVLSLSTHVIIMLFMQSLTYALTNPDNGTCEALTTRQTCLTPQSAYATGAPMCAWTPSSSATTGASRSTEGSCTFVQPDSQIKIILFVAIFAALVSTPIAIMVDWVLMEILSAPLKCQAGAEGAQMSNTDNDGEEEPSRTIEDALESAVALRAAAAVSNNSSIARPGLRRMSVQSVIAARKWIGAVTGLDTGGAALTAEQQLVQSAQRELVALSEALIKYRRTLAVEEVTEFNCKLMLILCMMFLMDDDKVFLLSA